MTTYNRCKSSLSQLWHVCHGVSNTVYLRNLRTIIGTHIITSTKYSPNKHCLGIVYKFETQFHVPILTVFETSTKLLSFWEDHCYFSKLKILLLANFNNFPIPPYGVYLVVKLMKVVSDISHFYGNTSCRDVSDKIIICNFLACSHP